MWHFLIISCNTWDVIVSITMGLTDYKYIINYECVTVTDNSSWVIYFFCICLTMVFSVIIYHNFTIIILGEISQDFKKIQKVSCIKVYQ